MTIRNGVINEKSGAINLSSTERSVLEAIINTPNITKNNLQMVTSIEKGTIDRTIKALKEKEVIERVGSNKNGYWKVLK